MRNFASILAFAALAACFAQEQASDVVAPQVPGTVAEQSVSSASNEQAIVEEGFLLFNIDNTTKTASFPMPKQLDGVGPLLTKVLAELDVAGSDDIRRQLQNQLMKNMNVTNPGVLVADSTKDEPSASFPLTLEDTQLDVIYYAEDGDAITAARSFLVRNDLDVQAHILPTFRAFDNAIRDVNQDLIQQNFVHPFDHNVTMTMTFPRWAYRTRMESFAENSLRPLFVQNKGFEVDLVAGAKEIAKIATERLENAIKAFEAEQAKTAAAEAAAQQK